MMLTKVLVRVEANKGELRTRRCCLLDKFGLKNDGVLHE